MPAATRAVHARRPSARRSTGRAGPTSGPAPKSTSTHTEREAPWRVRRCEIPTTLDCPAAVTSPAARPAKHTRDDQAFFCIGPSTPRGRSHPSGRVPRTKPHPPTRRHVPRPPSRVGPRPVPRSRPRGPNAVDENRSSPATPADNVDARGRARVRVGTVLRPARCRGRERSPRGRGTSPSWTGRPSPKTSPSRQIGAHVGARNQGRRRARGAP